jgi:hypothetical protein
MINVKTINTSLQETIEEIQEWQRKNVWDKYVQFKECKKVKNLEIQQWQWENKSEPKTIFQKPIAEIQKQKEYKFAPESLAIIFDVYDSIIEDDFNKSIFCYLTVVSLFTLYIPFYVISCIRKKYKKEGNFYLKK